MQKYLRTVHFLKQCWEVFWRFLILGCISFGGPGAHIGYFQHTFVEKLAWLSSDTYAKIISISQILPGPGSSQMGFAIGLHKAGLAGGIAAFIGFTLPSFILMYWLAVSLDLDRPDKWLLSLTYSLKLLAVVVVLDAAINMFSSFCKTRLTVLIMLLSVMLLVLHPSFITQALVLFIAMLIGMVSSSKRHKDQVALTRAFKNLNWPPLVLFIGVFIVSIGLSQQDSLAGLFAIFYKNGSLVFGGGHVVLPLLQTSIAEYLTQQQFLFGYAAAQGVPGPMFTMATFMGAQWFDSAPLCGAILATLGIFLPGFLLILGIHHSWQSLTLHPKFIGGSTGINAAVVGLLVATLYNPVFVSAVHNYSDLALVVGGFLGLRLLKLPILALMMFFIVFGFLSGS